MGRPRDVRFTATADLLRRPAFPNTNLLTFYVTRGETCYPGTIDRGEHPAVNIGLGQFKILGASWEQNASMLFIRGPKKLQNKVCPLGLVIASEALKMTFSYSVIHF